MSETAVVTTKPDTPTASEPAAAAAAADTNASSEAPATPPRQLTEGVSLHAPRQQHSAQRVTPHKRSEPATPPAEGGGGAGPASAGANTAAAAGAGNKTDAASAPSTVAATSEPRAVRVTRKNPPAGIGARQTSRQPADTKTEATPAATSKASASNPVSGTVATGDVGGRQAREEDSPKRPTLQGTAASASAATHSHQQQQQQQAPSRAQTAAAPSQTRQRPTAATPRAATTTAAATAAAAPTPRYRVARQPSGHHDPIGTVRPTRTVQRIPSAKVKSTSAAPSNAGSAGADATAPPAAHAANGRTAAPSNGTRRVGNGMSPAAAGSSPPPVRWSSAGPNSGATPRTPKAGAAAAAPASAARPPAQHPQQQRLQKGAAPACISYRLVAKNDGGRTPRAVRMDGETSRAGGNNKTSNGNSSGSPYDVELAQTERQRQVARRSRQPRKLMCVAFTKYTLVRKVAEASGFDLLETEEEFDDFLFNMCWSDTVLPLIDIVRLANWQRTNHFPSMYLLCRKAHLGTTLGKLRKRLPTHFNFYPYTWTMRGERVQLSRYIEALAKKKLTRYFIMKPSAGCQGRGIVVTRDPLHETVEDVDNYIVQEYIPRPLLIEGLKFDLRIYVLLTSIREPSVFLFNDGLVRLCTAPYEAPSDRNAGDACKHLTNYAVNKHSADYVFNTDVEHMDVGSKRNFAFFNRWLAQEGHDAAVFWDNVAFLIVKTIFAAQPQICHVYNNCFPRYNDGYSCFEVLGFDVLVDSKMKPWLMEVNHTPSFAADTPLDHDIKSRLLAEVWDIIDCRATDHERDRQREREAFARRNVQPYVGSTIPTYTAGGVRVNGGSAPATNTTTTAADVEEGDGTEGASRDKTSSGRVVSEAVRERRLREDSKLKNFTRIYPSARTEQQIVYDTIQNLATKECDAAFGAGGGGGGGGGSHTPLNASQMAQNDRLRRDLRDIVNHTFAARSTPRGSRTPRRGSAAARTPRSALGSGSPTSAGPTAGAAGASGPSGGASASSTAEEYRRMKEEMGQQRRNSKAAAPAPAAAAPSAKKAPADAAAAAAVNASPPAEAATAATSERCEAAAATAETEAAGPTAPSSPHTAGSGSGTHEGVGSTAAGGQTEEPLAPRQSSSLVTIAEPTVLRSGSGSLENSRNGGGGGRQKSPASSAAHHHTTYTPVPAQRVGSSNNNGNNNNNKGGKVLSPLSRALATRHPPAKEPSPPPAAASSSSAAGATGASAAAAGGGKSRGPSQEDIKRITRLQEQLDQAEAEGGQADSDIDSFSLEE